MGILLLHTVNRFFTHSLWYIVNLIKNLILKGISYSDLKKIKKRAKNFGDPGHDPQLYLNDKD